ncbi:chromate transporter [Paenibacillus naphthalenovorans]|uniref:chromate transporter n=1 Tax=Paenibacillus naphthalenovorans TaxID=162209 RepID=UPI0009425D52|nr:chromate transporter [Paenibacillus naphthalenovorans]GCL73015.1 chromate transporter [Paenibacillus naphthalenovorans]
MTKSNGVRPYMDLVWAMGRTGILGFGGGPSVIPLIRYEAVTRYRWMEDDEFGEILALANALPGPIATKIAAYLGYRQKGISGAIISVLAHIMPSAVAMIALLSAAQLLSASPIVQGMIAAVTPVIAVMLGVMAYEFAERAVKGLGKPVGFALFLVCFALLQIIDIHPAFVVIAFLGYGAFHFKTTAWFNKKKTRKEDYTTWSG